MHQLPKGLGIPVGPGSYWGHFRFRGRKRFRSLFSTASPWFEAFDELVWEPSPEHEPVPGGVGPLGMWMVATMVC